ncbi:TPA: SGNH/GDSL hydrolase family protein [Klebsiella pneumoniae]|nr:SGNH/GDSL hydrolase family protein [Klebsiella pneumoniae]
MAELNPPLGTTTPEIFMDNVKRADELVNGPAGTVNDRGGEPLDTWREMMAKNDEVRQNIIPLSKQYMTLEAAQTDIANIPSGTTTYVRNADGSSLANEYINNAGTLEATGRKMPSQQAIDDVYSFIAENDILSPGRNIYNYRTSLDGKYLNEQGVVSDNTSYVLSDYMPVAEQSPYVSNYNLRFVHSFDKDKVLLGYVEQVTQFTTPANAAYIRISMGIASKQLLQIEQGTLTTAFKNYRENVSDLPDQTPVSLRNAMGVAPGKNLFNKSTATQGYVINENGVLIVASTYFVSDYIKVTAGGTLRPSQPARYINFYDANKKWLSSLQSQNAAFGVPTSAVYVRISVLLARIDYFQLEVGSKMTAYEPFSLKAASVLDGDGIKYPVNEPDIYSIGLFNAGKNIFNPYTLTAGYIDENGFVVPGGAAYKFSDYLPVKAETAYSGNDDMRFINFYDANKSFLSTVTSTSTFTTPSNAAYVRVTLALAKIEGFQLEEGASTTDYEAFNYTVKSTLPHGEPVSINSSDVPDSIVPDYFGLERLRETHQRLNKLRFGATGLSARLTVASGIDSYSRDTSIYLLRSARQLWSIYQSGAANVASGPIGWGYLSFGGADTSLKNGSIINPNAVTAAGFVGTYYGGDSPDISVMESSTVGATLSWSEDFRLARSHTLFAEAGSGVISYLATGMTEPTQIDLSALEAGIQIIALNDIPTTSNGTFTITVVSGTVKLYGMNIVDPTSSGVVWHKLGASGSSTANWIARDATRWKQSFAALGANLFTIMTGTNDQGAGMTAATFRTNLLELIDRARAARPDIDILLICPAENQRTTNAYPMTTYARVMYEIARDDRDVAFLNLQSSFGVKPADYAAGSTRPWMNTDGIHPDPDTGGYAIVAALMRALGLPAV